MPEPVRHDDARELANTRRLASRFGAVEFACHGEAIATGPRPAPGYGITGKVARSIARGLIDNVSQQPYGHRMRLDELPLRHAAQIAAIDWEALDVAGARRLRELGFDEGVQVETLHRGPFGYDPIACRIGKMTIALRKGLAAAVTVTPA